MALINHRTHEIHFKIVYYGPGLCGKTTNLKSLHDRLPPERRGRMISIATDQERTLFFDFLPIDLGQVNGFLTRFHLYTVPGQVYYKLSRRAVLQGVDGLVFVADSHPARETANRESLADLNEHLHTLGLTGPALARIPWVFQYNKRDVQVAVPVERLKKALNPQNWPEFEAIASEGKGVSETLRAACKAVLARLGAGQSTTQPTTPAPASAATPVAAAPRVQPAAAPAAFSAASATAIETPAAEVTPFAAQVARAAAAAAAKFAAAGPPATPSAIAVPRPPAAPTVVPKPAAARPSSATPRVPAAPPVVPRSQSVPRPPAATPPSRTRE